MIDFLLAPLVDLPFHWNLLFKATLVIGLGWLLQFFCSLANPRWKVLIWRLVVISILVIPAFEFSQPFLKVPIETREPVIHVGHVASPAPTPPNRTLSVLSSTKMDRLTHPPNPPSILDFENQDAHTVSFISYEKTPEFGLEWEKILFGIWLIVVTILLGQSFKAATGVRKIVESSVLASPRLKSFLDSVSNDLEYHKEIRLLSNQHVSSPFLTLGWTPTLVVPSSMASFSEEDLCGVFAHEISHLRYHDLRWMILFRLTGILLWFHPFFWKVPKSHSSACEQVSDAVAATYVGDPLAYMGTLSEVALSVKSRQKWFPAIPMARSSKIGDRLALLERKVYSASLRKRWIVGSILSGVVAVFCIGGFSVVHADSTNNDGPKIESILPARTVQFPTGKIVGGLYVSVESATDSIDSVLSMGGNSTVLGNASGRIEVPEGFEAGLTIFGDEKEQDYSFLTDLRPDDIQSLVIADNSVSDKVLKQIGRLSGLKFLSLRPTDAFPREPGKTQFTKAGLDSLEGLGNLVLLKLTSPSIGDGDLMSLSAIPSLRAVYIEEASMDGSGMRDWSSLKNLEVLSFEATQLTDSSLDHLKLLPKLSRLTLSKCPIGDAGVRHLGEIRTLIELNLNQTNVSDDAIPDLVKLTSLETLKVRGTRITQEGYSRLSESLPSCKIDIESPKSFAGGTRIIHFPKDRYMGTVSGFVSPTTASFQYFNYYSRRIGSASGDIEVPEDENIRLCLSLFALHDLSPLKSLGPSDLQGIYIFEDFNYGYPMSNMSFSGGLDWLQGLTGLLELNLANASIPKRELSNLLPLVNLKHLILKGARFSEQDYIHLGDLKSLEFLNLDDTDLDNEKLASIASLGNLRGLSISGKSITDEGLRVFQNLTSLEVLTISEISLEGPGLQFLKNLSNLSILNLHSVNLTDENLKNLPRLPGLEELSIWGSKIKSDGLVALSEFKSLKKLDLRSSSDLTGGLVHLVGLDSLTSLNLSKTGIGDDDLEPIAQLKNLNQIDLSGTLVTDRGVNQLALLPSMRFLNLTWTQVSKETVLLLKKANPDLNVNWDGTNQAGYADPEKAANIKGVLIPLGEESVAQMTVSLYNDWGNDPFFLRQIVGEDGVFNFINVPTGASILSCHHTTRLFKDRLLFTPLHLELKQGETREIEWRQETGGWKGRIDGIDPEFSWSLTLTTSDPSSAWYNVGNFIYSTDISQDGTYEIRGISRGIYSLALRYYSEDQSDLTYKPLILESDGKTLLTEDIEVSLHSLSGRIVDSSGEPVEAIQVALHTFPDIMPREFAGRSITFTDSGGNFRFPTVGAGSHRLDIAGIRTAFPNLDLDPIPSEFSDLGPDVIQRVEKEFERSLRFTDASTTRSKGFFENFIRTKDFPTWSIPVEMPSENKDMGDIAIERSKSILKVHVSMNPDMGKQYVTVTAVPLGETQGGNIREGERIESDSGTVTLQPIPPGSYQLILNDRTMRSGRWPALRKVDSVTVTPGKVTELKVSLGVGVWTPLYVGPKDKLAFDSMQSIWIQSANMGRIEVEPHVNYCPVSLVPGTYQFGVTLEDGSEESIEFEVTEETAGVERELTF